VDEDECGGRRGKRHGVRSSFSFYSLEGGRASEDFGEMRNSGDKCCASLLIILCI
jgi:hypothetical protein